MPLTEEKTVKLESYRPEPHPLKGALARRDISQRLFARFLGVSYAYLNGILNGYNSMPESMKQKTEQFLGLVNGESKNDDKRS